MFGSKYVKNSKDVDNFISRGFNKKYFDDKTLFNFLKIAIFDLWMANEDRVINNPNLLVSPKGYAIDIIAYDHEKCFNSNSGMALCQLTAEDSILQHEILKLFTRKETNYYRIIEQVCLQFENYSSKCKKTYKAFFDNVPKDWVIDYNYFIDYFESNLFSKKWIEDTKKNFRGIIGLQLK